MGRGIAIFACSCATHSLDAWFRVQHRRVIQNSRVIILSIFESESGGYAGNEIITSRVNWGVLPPDESINLGESNFQLNVVTQKMNELCALKFPLWCPVSSIVTILLHCDELVCDSAGHIGILIYRNKYWYAQIRLKRITTTRIVPFYNFIGGMKNICARQRAASNHFLISVYFKL